MEPFISFRSCRNGEWKGHTSKRGVRAAIRMWQRHGGLRIFAYDGVGTYNEVAPQDWDEMFGSVQHG